MDEGDGDTKNNIDGDFEEDLKCQDTSLVPLPVLLGRREIGNNRFLKFTAQQLENWGEESLVQSKHSQLNCQLPGTPKSTFLMVFSPDGTKVASTHGDHNIYVTDVKTGKCICTLKGHPRTPWSVAFHPSSNEIVASGCLDGQVRVWDLKGGSEVWTPEKKHVIASLAFHPTDQVLVIATDNELYFWDWFCPEPFAKISTGTDKEKVKYVKFDPLGYKLITGIANVKGTHRYESNLTNCSSASSGPTSTCRNSTTAPTNVSHPPYSGWTNRATRYMDRYRPRVSSQNSEVTTQDASNQTANSSDITSQRTDPHRARNFARIIRELNDRTRAQESGSANGSVGPSDSSSSENVWRPYFRNGSNRSGRDSSVQLEEDLRLGEIRNPIRPVSDDSGSSSSLDSSSSVASSLSGTSHERNTRLSLLWTSRLNRTGNDSDNSVIAGYDLEERRGEGTIMRGDAASTSELNAAIPLADNEPLSSIADNENDSGGESDTRAGSTSSTGGRSVSQGGRWMYYRGKFPWNMPHPRLRSSHLGAGNDAASESNRVGCIRNPSRLLRSSNNVRQQTTTHGLNSLSAPGPSGISQRIPSTSGAPPLSDSLNQSSSSRTQNSSLLDPHFGVQLLSRHIENMQRICRSLSLPRAHLELTRHRHEITRLQQIRSMLYDIQHQIRALRASVDQTISEEFSDVIHDESLNAINTTSPTSESIRAELLNSSSVADQVEIEVDIQDELNNYSYSTLAEEDPEQLVPVLASRDVPPPLHVYESTSTSNSTQTIPTVRNQGTRTLSASRASTASSLSRSRLLARLQRPSAPGSRVRSRIYSRNRLVWPWLIRRLPHRRRPTRSRVNLSSSVNNINPSSVIVTRASVGLGRNRTSRRVSVEDRENRSSHRVVSNNPRSDNSSRVARRISTTIHPAPVASGEIGHQVRRRHSGDWQRRLRSLVAADFDRETLGSTETESSVNQASQHAIPSDQIASAVPSSEMSHIEAIPSSNGSLDADSGTPTVQDMNRYLYRTLTTRRPNPIRRPFGTPSSLENLSSTSAMEESQRSLLEIQAEVDHLSEVILSNARPFINSSQQIFGENPSPNRAEDLNSNSRSGNLTQSNPSFVNNRPVAPSQNNIDDTLDEANFNNFPAIRLLDPDQPEPIPHSVNNNNLLDGNSVGNHLSDEEDSEMPERVTRSGPPTTSLSSRIAAMLSQQESTLTTSAANTTQPETSRNTGASVLAASSSRRPNADIGNPPRLRESGSPRFNSNLPPGAPFWPYYSGFHSPPPSNPFFEEDEFLLRDGEARDADDRPFLQSLRSLRREIMISHRNRTLRRNSLVSGGDLAGATLAAINPNMRSPRDNIRETVRTERRERYRQMLQMMADRLNRLMNRSLLSQHLRENPEGAFQTEDENDLLNPQPQSSFLRNSSRQLSAFDRLEGASRVGGSGRGGSLSNSTNSASAAIDNHMRNLRLLVRLALHLIYQLLNFICNQNISYEERPISRLPNPFREEEENTNQRADRSNSASNAVPNAYDLDIEPGLHNLTTLLETVRMASEELRNDALNSGEQSLTRNAPAMQNANQPFSSRLASRTSSNTPSELPQRNISDEPSTRTLSFREYHVQGLLDAASSSSATSNDFSNDSTVRRRLSNFLIRNRNYVVPDMDFLDRTNRSQPEQISNPLNDSNEQQNSSTQGLSTNPHQYRPPPNSARDYHVSPPPLIIPQIVLSDLSEERHVESPLQHHDSVDNLGSGSSNPLPNDEFTFHLRSFGGIPLRFLGRQNAVDRRSPDSEDSASTSQAGREENGENGPGLPHDRSNNISNSHSSIGRHPFRPWGLYPGSPIRPIPNLPSAESPFVDRGPERGDPDHFMYFSRPFFNHYMATRNISVSFYDPYSPLFAGASNPTHRIQAWDFSNFQIPDISDSLVNIVVQKCKIHFDASVSISEDGNMLAALIPENQPLTRVCVFSLETKTLGQVLYSSIMDSNTICVSISPTMKHLVVGFASYHTRLSVHHNEKQLVASIYKLCDNPPLKEHHQAGTLLYLKAIELQRDHRLVSLNCIRWMPFPGQGLIYGTNRGQLTILR